MMVLETHVKIIWLETEMSYMTCLSHSDILLGVASTTNITAIDQCCSTCVANLHLELFHPIHTTYIPNTCST